MDKKTLPQGIRIQSKFDYKKLKVALIFQGSLITYKKTGRRLRDSYDEQITNLSTEQLDKNGWSFGCYSPGDWLILGYHADHTIFYEEDLPGYKK